MPEAIGLGASLGDAIIPITKIVFVGTCLLFLIITFVLDFHWRHYSVGTIKLQLIRLVYLGVSGLILLLMIGAMLGTY